MIVGERNTTLVSSSGATISGWAQKTRAHVAAGLSTEARRYALDELAARAGVDEEFRTTWTIEYHETETVVSLGAPVRRIHLPNAPPEFWAQLADGKFEVARASWPFEPSPSVLSVISDFVVPFVPESRNGPLFNMRRDGDIDCSVDLLASLLLTLSRFEESLTEERDVHGRFTAAQSIATKHDFLTRPIVDEYGLAFAQLLTAIVPEWKPTPACLRVKLSHDIDDVQIPVRLRTAIGHTLRRHDPVATLRDLMSPLGARTEYLQCVLRLATLSRQQGLDSAFYWKGSPVTDKDTGYATEHPKVQSVIRRVKAEGFEMGVHPGYMTFHAPDKLQQEVERLRKALDEMFVGGRQHFLRWSPQTWSDWEQCGLAYDSTVGFADHVGFRCGTSYPYRPWLLHENRRAQILEIPLISMDNTLTTYMKLRGNQLLAPVRDCIKRCELVGGVFTLLWHNTTLLEPEYGDRYLTFLGELAGAPRFDWRQACRQVSRYDIDVAARCA